MNWLPRDGLMRSVCCIEENAPQKASELIDQSSRVWNKKMVQEFFIPMDSEVIGSIPLATSTQEDFWAWHYEESGVFSVRSAYTMLVHNREKRTAWLDRSAGRSDTKSEEKEWSQLWKVRVPSKVRVFLWRLSRQSIPTRDVRHRRNMSPNSSCSICGDMDSWKHSLLDCFMVKGVWTLEKEEITEFLCQGQVQEIDAQAWLAAVTKHLAHDDLTRIVVRL